MKNQLDYSNPPTKVSEPELGMRHQVLVLRSSHVEPDCQEDYNSSVQFRTWKITVSHQVSAGSPRSLIFGTAKGVSFF